MYIPPLFRVDDVERQSELMRNHPLATLVTSGANGLIASHIPLLYEPAPDCAGILHGHMAKANPQWREIRADVEALAIFHGPQTYISPTWYATTRRSGRVVPTWNYAVVHAYGSLECYTDAARLGRHVEALTAAHEKNFSPPWSPNDAPADFIAAMLDSIVGIDLRITRLEGKWKVSQNRTAEDRAGVVEELTRNGDAVMARLIREHEP